MNKYVDLTSTGKDAIPELLFWQNFEEHPEIISDSWQTSLDMEEAIETFKDFAVNGGIIHSSFREMRGEYYRAIITNDDYKILLTYKNENCFFALVGKRGYDTKSILSNLKVAFPEANYNSEDNTLQVKFHFSGIGGPTHIARKLEMVNWENIRGNYTQPVQENLEKLMTYVPDDITAKLILWYGIPGTGKSFSIHALAWAWREWCTFEYITDPERFFNDPQYMLNLILTNQRDWGDAASYHSADSDWYDETSIIQKDKSKKRPSNKDKWKLLILEDAGDLIAEDAKVQAGSQALARLLNLMDGFIGQGVKVMMLITTNEEIGKLNKAVSRSGRTLSKLEYKALTKDEANVWLENNGIDGRVEGSISLADLYAHKTNPTEFPLKSSAGFGLKKS